MAAPGNFNPFAGGKIVVNPVLGGNNLVNQGGIGIQAGNSLQQAFSNIQPTWPYRERFGPDGEQQLQMGYVVPWSIRKAWVDFMLGYSTTLALPVANGAGLNILNGGFNLFGSFSQAPPTPPGGTLQQENASGQNLYYLSRQPPYQCPALGYEHLYCSSVEVTADKEGIFADPAIVSHDALGNVDVNGVGGNIPDIWPKFQDTKSNADALLHYVATFTPRPYEVRSDGETAAITTAGGAGEMERYVEKQTRAAIINLPLPAGAYKFAPLLSAYNPLNGGQDGNNPLSTSAAAILLPTDELVYIWNEVPDEPTTAIASCVGFVNSQPFDGARGRQTYPAGSLLCQAPLERKRYRHTTGRWFWRITYSLLYRPQGHNFFPNSQGAFQLVTSDGTVGGKPVYPSIDLNQLFVAPAPLTPNLGFRGG